MDSSSSTGSRTPIPSEITEFYKNKNLFITGATGFLGKTLVEKLLRSCHDLNKIYMLVRAKRGKTSDERLNEFTQCKLFEKVKALHPDFKKKLVAVNGDLSEDGLGISETDLETLRSNVNIVFHSAATVRFDEPMKTAVNMNIVGVKKVIDLCKTMKHLISFVHISTAYANCDRAHIREEIYNSPVKPDRLIEACEWLNAETFDLITSQVIQEKPNTYTYTKQIAESMVLQECMDLPVSIIRPSIIGATWREPFPGWVESFNGPTAIFPAGGTGVLRTMLGNREAVADIIPVDVSVNLMVAVAWYTAKKKNKKITVFNNTSGQINRFTWGMMQEYIHGSFEKYPFEKIFFIPGGRFTKNKYLKFVRCLIEQLIPAYTIDFFLAVFKQKTLFVKIQKKIQKAVKILEYFTTKQWEFTNDNIFMLMNELNETDIQMFNFDVTDLNWKDYIEQYSLGTKIHLMKDDITKLQLCRDNLAKMRRRRVLLLSGISVLFFKFVLMRSKYISFIFRLVYSLVLRFGKNLLNLIRLNSSAKPALT